MKRLLCVLLFLVTGIFGELIILIDDNECLTLEKDIKALVDESETLEFAHVASFEEIAELCDDETKDIFAIVVRGSHRICYFSKLDLKRVRMFYIYMGNIGASINELLALEPREKVLPMDFDKDITERIRNNYVDLYPNTNVKRIRAGPCG